MGSDELQVVLGQLGVAASQWQGLGTQLAARATPPGPGQPFQATAAAVSGIDAAGQLTAATAGLSSVGFAQNPMSPTQAPATRRNGVQLVDFKQNGGEPPPFAPWDPLMERRHRERPA